MVFSWNRLKLFYLLSLAPLALIGYYSYVQQQNIFGVLIPLYGFLLLLIKRDRLSAFPQPGNLQRLTGLVLICASFFVYYAIAYFHPAPLLYGAANYTLHIIGLFLAFFSMPALKEAFTVVFLIAAGASSYYVGKVLEGGLEPLVPYFVQFMVVVVRALGIPATLGNPRTIMLHTSEGALPVLFEAGCIGIYSFLTFSVIIVVTMIEDSSNIRTRLYWALAGVVGTFIINIIRVSLIAVVIYHFGYEVWPEVHSKVGYALFLAWLAFFFLLFSKKSDILITARNIFEKVRGRLSFQSIR